MALTVAFVASANAAMIVNNGTPNQSGGSDLITNISADDFTLTDTYIINLVRYWTLQDNAGSYTGPTDWSVLADSSGAPGSAVASGSFTATQAATGQSASGLSEFEHTAAVSISLGPGTYWFALSSSSSSPGSVNWAFNNAVSGNAQAFEIGVGPWGSISAELAFQLEGDLDSGIPEPSTYGLISAGLIAIVAHRRRRAA